MSALRRLWQYARDFHTDCIRAIVYSTINKLLDVAPELLIGTAIQVVATERDYRLAYLGLESSMAQLIALGVTTFIVFSLESITEYVQSITWRTIAHNVQHSLRTDAYRHVQNVPMSTLEKRRAGELVTILNDDINQIEQFFYTGGNEFVHLIVGTLAIGAIFFYLAPLIACIALTPIPVIIIITVYFQKMLKKHYRIVREKASYLASRITNNLLGIMTIKSYVTQYFELQRVNDESRAYKRANEDALVVSSAFTPVVRIAIVLGFISTLILGGWYTLNGYLAVGAYSILVFQTQRLLWPLTRLGDVTDMFERTMAASQRVLDLIDMPTVPRDTGTRCNPQDVHGTIDFSFVSFAYEADKPILDDFSLHIPAGNTVAFVGPSGCGKSTLIRLLLRFHEPTKGSITLDRTPLDELNIDDIRKAIAYVSQDIFLFHGTIKDNIAYGSPHVTNAEIEEAARKAHAHEFITTFPHGYDTLIQEHGYPLSGGQKQRIGIARALAKDAPIYIFDEATSAIDNITEAAIQDELDATLRDRTRIIIAHRLNNIVNADIICVLDHGRIIEAGSHHELMERQGVYYNLWNQG